MSITQSLNREQLSPVLQTEGAVLVTAGAGSGKTRLLTQRIAYLIHEKGVSPYNILAITFTNKAAREMQERVSKLVGEDNPVWISTFHSMCVRMLRRDIEKIGFSKNFSIYSEAEKSSVLKGIYRELGIDDEDTKRSIEYHISNAKNNNLSPSQYEEHLADSPRADDIITVYTRYDKVLRKSNALDFDDLLTKTHQLLSSCPEVLEYYGTKFRYIHVDEFQDTNRVQYEIVRLLAKKNGNIMVVGDEDQCIYGWRGANIQNIIDFQKDFSKVNIFKLEQNYRSTKSIIEIANRVIANNETRLKKTLWTDNKQGAEVVRFSARSDREEADFVIRKILELVHKQGYHYNDFAILMRLNALSRAFESSLNNGAIPYKVLGGFKFFERVEIKNILAYLRLLSNPFDNESFTRIINVPKRGIGETTVSKLVQLSQEQPLINNVLNISNHSELPNAAKAKLEKFGDLYRRLLEKINLPVSELVSFVVEEVNFKQDYQSGDEEDITKLLNIEQFVQSVQEFQDNNPNATLEDYLQSVTLMSDIDNANMASESVLVSTVHAVKGLEFKVVFVVGAEEGIFPMFRGGERPSDLEEERRLMYVAMTRAQDELFFTHSSYRIIWGREQYQKASRFLAEMGLSEMPQVPGFKSVNAGNLTSVISAKIEKQAKDLSEFTCGTKVFHPNFGAGEITDDSELLKSKRVTVYFGAVGAKTLSLEYAPLQILKK